MSVATTGLIEPRLIVITDFTRGPEAVLFERIERVLGNARPRSVMVQLRDHDLSARRRHELGIRLRALTRANEQFFVVNDRIDLALALGADGVHLGEASVSADEARRLLDAGAFVSRACHDPNDCDPRGADAVILAPIAAGRHGRPALGLEALRRANGNALLYALGGVDADNARAMRAAGATGVAVIGAVLERDDPTPLLAALAITAAAAGSSSRPGI